MIEKSARELSRNPLGLIALFIVLVYGIAALSLGLTSTLTQGERVPIVWFLVAFPVLVLAVFCWLVSKHHEKLYAPGDYKSDDGFLSAAQIRSRHVVELQAQQEQLQERLREAVEKSVPAGVPVDQVIQDVRAEFTRATQVTIDARTFTGRPDALKVYPVGAFDTVNAFTNEVYFFLRSDVKPFEYGHSWVLRNIDTDEVIKTARVITGTPRGVRLDDSRALHEVGIVGGVTLRVERPSR